MKDEPAPGPGAAGPVLAVDPGNKRVGLALGDPASGLVLPLPTLDHPGSEDGLIERLVEVARARDAAVVLIGRPLHMSGAESKGSREAARLAEKLAAALAKPVHLVDERGTSAAAEAELAARGVRWWQFPKSQLDAMAAMTLVRDWLSAQGLLPPEAEPTAEEGPPARPERERRRGDLRKRSKRRRGEEEDE